MPKVDLCFLPLSDRRERFCCCCCCCLWWMWWMWWMWWGQCRGFTGELCAVDLNECEPNPCHNGGTCVNIVGSFQCLCRPNTTGHYCTEHVTRNDLIISSGRHGITLEEVLLFFLPFFPIFPDFSRFFSIFLDFSRFPRFFSILFIPLQFFYFDPFSRFSLIFLDFSSIFYILLRLFFDFSRFFVIFKKCFLIFFYLIFFRNYFFFS